MSLPILGLPILDLPTAEFKALGGAGGEGQSGDRGVGGGEASAGLPAGPNLG